MIFAQILLVHLDLANAIAETSNTLGTPAQPFTLYPAHLYPSENPANSSLRYLFRCGGPIGLHPLLPPF